MVSTQQPKQGIKKMGKMKANDRRAWDFAHDVREYGIAKIIVEWRRSREWGLNPAVMYAGQKIGFASGCGYCKESAALSDALQYLGKEPENYRKILACAGRGVSHLTKVLEEMGVKLTALHHGKTEHVYTVSVDRD